MSFPTLPFLRQNPFLSGERFDVDSAADLTGFCDFLLTQSAEQIAIEAPVVIVVEVKQDNIKSGLGQCAATMGAAQKFNQADGRPRSCIFGSISTGTVWRFLKLEEQVLTLDTVDYTVPPVDRILGVLSWMCQHSNDCLTSAPD